MNEKEYPFIEDVDKSLYKYGMIYKQDINNFYLNNKISRFKQKFKCLAITAFLWLNPLKFAVAFKLTKDGRVPDYCFDFIQEFGGLIIYFYFAGSIIALMATAFNCYIISGNETKMKWIEIIKVLKGVSSVENLRINNEEEIKKFFVNSQKLFKIFRISFICAIISIFLNVILIMIFNYDFYYALKYGFISALVFCLYLYYSLGIIYHTIMYFFIICYYCKILTNNLNKNLEYLIKKFFISKKAIDNLLKDHNYMCNTIQEFNIFWKNIYLSLILGSVLITALILHQIFFEDLPEYTL
jgi:hypothetical protein